MVKEAQKELNKQKETLKACNQDINEKIKEQRGLQKEAQEADLKIKELDHKVAKCNKDSKDAAKTVSVIFCLKGHIGL